MCPGADAAGIETFAIVRVMFESDADRTSNELGFNTYATLGDLLSGNQISSQFSTVNVNNPFSSTGLMTEPNPPDGTVPELNSLLPLMGPLLAGLWRETRSKRI